MTRPPVWQPAIVQALRGYTRARFRSDLIAGITVGLVAIPLAMAFGIASGVTPQAGMYTAIVGGFIVSLLGGSRVQIGGPTGAFIVLVASTIEQHGYSGFVAATIMAGVFLLLIGYLRLGTYTNIFPIRWRWGSPPASG